MLEESSESGEGALTGGAVAEGIAGDCTCEASDNGELLAREGSGFSIGEVDCFAGGVGETRCRSEVFLLRYCLPKVLRMIESALRMLMPLSRRRCIVSKWSSSSSLSSVP